MAAMLAASQIDRSWVSLPLPHDVQVHAPTVVSTSRGLVAAWFAGAHEGSSDTRIHVSRHLDGRWTPPEIVAPAPTPHWNPVLAHGPDGHLWLFFKRGPAISSWVTWRVTSADDGATWSAPRRLVDCPSGDPAAGSGGRGPVKNPPLLSGGAWLAPGSTEVWHPEPRWEAFVDISTDGGKSWRKVPIPIDRSTLRGAGVIQPALWEGADGTVHALMRSTEGRAYASHSSDGGSTWAPAQPTGLPNNNSALTVVEIEPGTVLCVYNPTPGDWAVRCPLIASVSRDDGATWTDVAVLDDGATPIDDDPLFQPVQPTPADAPQGADTGVLASGAGEYSYPAACLEGEDIIICYTWQRRRIVVARLPLRHVRAGSPPEEKDR